MPTTDDSIASLLATHGLPAPDAIEPVAAGTLNRNFRVLAGGESWFVREVRGAVTREMLAAEHEVVRWVATRGLPVAVPRDVAGHSFIELDGHAWVLFPWVDGELVPGGTLLTGRAFAMGEIHGRMHALLAGHPRSVGATWLRRWNRAASVELLHRVIIAAREQDAPAWMQEALDIQRGLLETWDVQPEATFAGMPVQLVHGDFHDQQVLFAPGGDTVTLIADWELTQCAPRAWEVVRALDFSRLIDDARLEPYLAGYREHVRLGEEEVRLAMRWWWQNRIIACWAWAEYFLTGNERIASVLPPTAAQMQLLVQPGWSDAITDRVIELASAGA